jgi:hypothetical protein
VRIVVLWTAFGGIDWCGGSGTLMPVENDVGVVWKG